MTRTVWAVVAPIFLIVPTVTHAVTFHEMSAQLQGLRGSTAAWGDYDNDQDLDILITGRDDVGDYWSRLYRNDGGATFPEVAGFSGVDKGSAVWGDYDNDDDLDILLTGNWWGNGALTRLYRNDGSLGFSAVPVALPGVERSSVAWGDHDNDGDLDILLAGVSQAGTDLTRVYRNDGDDDFPEVAGLPGVHNGAVAWGDYDNDADLDILLTGHWGLGDTRFSRLYRNDGDDLFTETVVLPDLESSAVAWGDYDNDGNLDILIAGDMGGTPISKVYRNTGGGGFVEAAGLPGVSAGSVAWGDCDNDGDLDILLTGSWWGSSITKVFANNGDHTFSEIAGISGVVDGDAAWGDYDNDGDLDILLTGYWSAGGTCISRVFQNAGAPPNTPPTTPTGLAVQVDGSTAAFSWSPATDAETPSAGLTYNLRVGTTPGGGEVACAMSASTGYRRLPALGNTNHNMAWSITLPGPGQYYWSVQALDPCFSASPFGDEQSIDTNAVGSSGFDDRPTQFALHASTPNPFRGTTNLRYDIPHPVVVRLTVHDVAGRLVRTLIHRQVPAGPQLVGWDGRDDAGALVSSGVYVCRLSAGPDVLTRKVVVAH